MVKVLVDPGRELWWKGPDGIFYSADAIGPVQGQIVAILLNHGNPVFLDAPKFMAAQLPSSSPTNVSFGIPQTFTPLDTSCGGCPRSSEPIKVNGNPLVLVGLSDFVYPPGVILELSLERGPTMEALRFSTRSRFR